MILGVLIALAILGPAFLFGGWIWMLCLGALSHIFGVAGLAIGFWPAVLVAIISYVLFGGMRK